MKEHKTDAPREQTGKASRNLRTVKTKEGINHVAFSF